MMKPSLLLATVFSMFFLPALDQQDSIPKAAPAAPAKKEHWYDKISLRGYTQVRYNRLLETNPDLKFDGDKSVGDKGSFLIRRARLIFSGDVHKHVFLY